MTREPTLLDTNVLSELMRPSPQPGVVRFVEQLDSPFVSAAVFQELAYGMALLPAGRRKARMSGEINIFLAQFETRTVAIDARVATLSGRLRADLKRAGLELAPMDALIAASAISISARLATRNVKDFRRLDLELVNPWMN